MSDLNAFDLEPGAIVGGYELLSRLGSGAMGSVWKVRDEGGQIYAMKMLRDSLSEDASADTAGQTREAMTARERLRREAMALRKVNHPGVCGIVDMELDDALAFIVTEFIEGKNLREDVSTNGRYTGDDLERLAGKLIDAVKAVHAAGIIHRDIKPTNVMIATTGPVLVDFGIAMGEGESHVTRTGLVMGTPGFIAPEIIDGAESNEATDWWSVASVLGFAATGRPVFGVKPMMAVLEREASGNADLSGLPPTTLRALKAALDPEPSRRPTPDDVLHAITMDALNPDSWNGNGSDQDTEEGTTVMPPFEEDATVATRHHDAPATIHLSSPPTHASHDNPRSQWAETSTTVYPRAAISSDDDGETHVLPAIDTATATLPLGHDQSDADPMTAVLPAPRERDPAMVVIPSDNGSPDDRNIPTPPSAPPESRTDVVALAWNNYLSSGTVAIWLLTAPLAVLASCMPLATTLITAFIFWISLIAGLNVQAQLDREVRRGGARTAGDRALRIVSLPWHVIKAVPGALVRMLINLVVSSVIVALAAIIMPLPYATVTLSWNSWHIPLPLLAGSPVSLYGLTLAGAAIISWLLIAFGPHSQRIRLGAGAIRGCKASTYDKAPPPSDDAKPYPGEGPSHGTHRHIALAIWLIFCIAVLTLLLATPSIDWAPITALAS